MTDNVLRGGFADPSREQLLREKQEIEAKLRGRPGAPRKSDAKYWELALEKDAFDAVRPRVPKDRLLREFLRHRHAAIDELGLRISTVNQLRDAIRRGRSWYARATLLSELGARAAMGLPAAHGSGFVKLVAVDR